MAGHRHFIAFPPDLIYSLNDFCRLNKTTSFRGLLATFNVFLYSYTGTTDISVGSPVSPPSELGLEDLIGFFVNTVVLRTRLLPELTFRDLLGQVDKVVREAVKHSDLPFDRIVEAARPPRDSARTPLFQVNFRAPKEPYPTLQLTGITAGPTRYVDNYTCKFDLALEIETSRADACYFEYRSDLFERSTIEQMVVDFEALLRSLIAQPDTPLDRATEVKRIRERVSSRSAGPWHPPQVI
jgi:non-ribosomal peptide synthetase component F